MGKWTILGRYFIGLSLLSVCLASSVPAADRPHTNGSHTSQSLSKEQTDEIMQLRLKNLRSLEKKTREEFRKLQKTNGTKIDEESYRKFFLGMVLGTDWWDMPNAAVGVIPGGVAGALPGGVVGAVVPGGGGGGGGGGVVGAVHGGVMIPQQQPSYSSFPDLARTSVIPSFGTVTPPSIEVTTQQVSTAISDSLLSSMRTNRPNLSPVTSPAAEYDLGSTMSPELEATYHPDDPLGPQATPQPSESWGTNNGDSNVETFSGTTLSPGSKLTTLPQWMISGTSSPPRSPKRTDPNQSNPRCQRHKHHRPHKSNRYRVDVANFMVILGRIELLPLCRSRPNCRKPCRKRQRSTNEMDTVRRYLSQLDDDEFDADFF